MSNLTRKESRFFTAGGVLKPQNNERTPSIMEHTSPQSNATSPSAKTVISPLSSPDRAQSTFSPPRTRNTSQQAPMPGSSRTSHHTRVNSNDTVVTALMNSPGSPDGGVPIGGDSDNVPTMNAAPRLPSRLTRSDSLQARTGWEGDERIVSPPRHAPNSRAQERQASTDPSNGTYPQNIVSPRDSLARSQSAKRNLMSQSSLDPRTVHADGRFLSPGYSGEVPMPRMSERLSAQNLHALVQHSNDTQDNINSILAQELRRNQENIHGLSQVAQHQQQRLNAVEDRALQLEQFSAGTSADLLRRVDQVEQQLNAMRVQSVHTTPVIGQFPQFAAGPPYSHPGHVQQPIQPQHPAYQPRSQHSSKPPAGQRNFRVSMVQLPSEEVAFHGPESFEAPGMQTPKAQIIPTFPSGAPTELEKISTITPNPADDVFGPCVPGPCVPGPCVPGPCAPGPLPKAQFGQKTYRELLTSLFSRSEMLVRQYFRSNYYANSKDPRAIHVIKIAAAHLGSRQAAEKILANQNLRIYVFIGMAHRWIVDHIYKQPLLDGYTDPVTAARLQQLFDKEFWYQENGPIYAMEYGLRRAFAAERSSICQKIAQQPGFWKWVQNLASGLTDDFMNQFSMLIPVHELARAREDFHKVMFEVTKVGVRMRQEPFFFEIIFYKYGVRFDFKGMIQRNEEYKGQAVDENPPQHVVRSCLSPCVIQKGFEGNTLQMETILKGEVHIVERKGNLR